MEFVARATWAAQSEPSQTKDALEVGKQHLDLLPELARDHILGRLGDGASDVADGFED